MKAIHYVYAFLALTCTLIVANWASNPKYVYAQSSNQVQGVAAVGSPATGIRPVIIGVSNGGTVANLGGDANGIKVQGAAAQGAAIAGNPVLIAGADASGNVRILQAMVAGTAAGATPNTLVVGGKDTSANVQPLQTDTSGRSIVVGGAANGAAASGNPVLIAGFDAGSSVVRYIPVGVGGQAFGFNGGNLVAGGSDGTNARALTVTVTGGAVNAGQTILNIGGSDSAGNAANMKFGNSTTVHVPADVFRQRVVNVPEFIGTQANLWNSAATGAGGTSTSVDLVGFANCTIFGNTSGATTFTVQASQDNSNFYDTSTTNAPAGAGNFGFNYICGSRYIRIKSSNNVTVTMTVGSKN